MSDHPAEAELNAFADGTLEATGRAAVERHLAECLTCRREVNGLRAVLAQAAVLPHEITPPRDLWVGIEARLEPTSGAPSGGRGWLAAAAVVLVLLATGTALLLLREVPSPDLADRPRPSSAVLDRPEWEVVEGQYARAAAEFAFPLEPGRELSPETVAVVAAGLRVVDQAIAESRAALARDPDSVALAGLLASAYERKIDLLRWANRLAVSS